MRRQESAYSTEELEQHLQIIEYFTRSIFEKNTVEDILWDIAENCISQLKFVDCVIYLVDAKRQVLVQKAALGNKRLDYRKILEPIEIPIGSGIVGACARSGASEIVDDVRDDPRYIVDDEMRLSEITVPIICNEEVIGIIDSEHPEAGFFTHHHLRVLENIAMISSHKIVRSIVEEENRENALFHTQNPNPVFRLSSNADLLTANQASIDLINAMRAEEDSVQLDELKSSLHHVLSSNQSKSILLRAGSLVFNATLIPVATKGYVNIYATDVTHLQKAKEDALEAKNAKAEFLSVMSHEMRTPLHAILGLSKLMAETALSGQQNEYLQSITFSGDNLLSLVNDILDFERLEINELRFRKSFFHPKDLFMRLAAGHRFEAARKFLEFSEDINLHGNLVLEGDKLRLAQVVNNLLSNAIKFTDQGVVRISVTGGYRGADTFVLKMVISDTGVGIDNDDQQKIFNAFEQVNENVTRQEGGTGLGLAIVKRLIELQGGQIEVESARGIGSHFKVELPFSLGSENIANDDELSEAADAMLRDAEVLIVDDNEINLCVAEAFLQKWGAKTKCLMNGREAIDAVEMMIPDLILMDIQMPEIDGLDATRAIRRLSNGIELPIIGLSADVSPSTEAKAFASGMNALLTKPFEPSELLRLLQRFL